MPAAEVRTWLRVRDGQSFSESALAQGLATVRAEYRARGYAQIQVQAKQVVEPPDQPDDAQRKVDLEVQVVEGARTAVRDVSFEGNTVLPVQLLREMTAMTPGRAFTEADRDSHEPPVILSASAARILFPGNEPLGHTVQVVSQPPSWSRVVGVVPDVRNTGLTEEPHPERWLHDVG
jgi:hypothetical protein